MIDKVDGVVERRAKAGSKQRGCGWSLPRRDQTHRSVLIRADNRCGINSTADIEHKRARVAVRHTLWLTHPDSLTTNKDTIGSLAMRFSNNSRTKITPMHNLIMARHCDCWNCRKSDLLKSGLRSMVVFAIVALQDVVGIVSALIPLNQAKQMTTIQPRTILI